ncbi:MAG: hypothetical protein U0174_08430 [Polyangiaceae bacterium]
MSTTFLRVTAFGSYPDVVERLRSVVEDLGTLLDVHFYSEVALALHVELRAECVTPFLDALSAVALRIDAAGAESLRAAALGVAEDSSIDVMLHVTVAEGDPDVSRVVPSVPG